MRFRRLWRLAAKRSASMVRRGSTGAFQRRPRLRLIRINRTHPRASPAKTTLRSRTYPAGGRRELPQAPGNPRKPSWRRVLLMPEIPAHSRSARNHHDRPVTPEVAGSHPVAPVKALQNGIILANCEKDRRLLGIPAAHPAPEIAGQGRLEPQIPAAQMTGPERDGKRLDRCLCLQKNSRS